MKKSTNMITIAGIYFLLTITFKFQFINKNTPYVIKVIKKPVKVVHFDRFYFSLTVSYSSHARAEAPRMAASDSLSCEKTIFILSLHSGRRLAFIESIIGW